MMDIKKIDKIKAPGRLGGRGTESGKDTGYFP